MFRYTPETGDFEFLKEFQSAEASQVRFKYFTDSVIWGRSIFSSEDEGNIFTINTDGTGFTKIYNNTNLDNGQNPVDFTITNNQIFVAFHNGGGIPYDDGTGGTSSSGSFASMDLDGGNFQTIVQGQDQEGTNPQSIVSYGEKLYGIYTGNGNGVNGRFVSFDYDGSNLAGEDIIRSGRGQLIVENDSLFGITSHSLFGWDLVNNLDTLLVELTYEGGIDATPGPVYFKNAFYFATRQGGTDGGGNILKFRKNKHPEVTNPFSEEIVLPEGFDADTVILSEIFTDPDGDILTFTGGSRNTDIVSISFNEDELYIIEEGIGSTSISISAADGREGLAEYVFDISVNGKPTLEEALNDIILTEGFGSTTIDLSTKFGDPEDDALTFSATSMDESVVTVSVDGNILTISEVALGSTMIDVTAEDLIGNTLTVNFDVEVAMAVSTNPAIDEISIGPNPTTSFLEINQNNYIYISAEIYDLSGAKIIRESLDKHHALDLRALIPGIYIMKLTGDKSTTMRLVVE